MRLLSRARWDSETLRCRHLLLPAAIVGGSSEGPVQRLGVRQAIWQGRDGLKLPASHFTYGQGRSQRLLTVDWTAPTTRCVYSTGDYFLNRRIITPRNLW
jgi:hypothetical protein